MSTVVIVVIGIPYSLVTVVVARLVGGHFAYKFLRDQQTRYSSLYKDRVEPDSEQWFLGLIDGLIIGLVWPLVLPYMFIFSKVFPKYAIGAEAKALSEKREEYIQELEKELDLR